MKSALRDCHCHTFRSHDSCCAPEALCAGARKTGLSGIAFTNHCDMHICKEKDVFSPLAASDTDVRCLRPVFESQLQALSGVEIGEGIWFAQETEKIYTLADWDIVLGSVHTVRFENDRTPYSAIDFSKWLPQRIHAFLDAYFRDVLETADLDIDVLCHLTCPLRYIEGRYGHAVALSEHEAAIEKILRRIIERNIALEINTSCMDSHCSRLLPDKDILQKYYAMGGRTITLGSDAHCAERVGQAFDKAVGILKEIGFSQCSYYVRRKKQDYAI